MRNARYWGLLIRVLEARRRGADGLEVDADMYVAFPNPEFRNRWQENLVPKLGLLVQTNQVARLRLSYLDRGVQPDQFVTCSRSEAASRQLEGLFGRDPDESWIALTPERPVVPEFLETNVATWRLRLEIAPLRGRPQLIPTMVVNSRADFTVGQHLGGLWVVPSVGESRQ